MAINPKNKAQLLAPLSIRSDAVDGGGSIPEDECQVDFIISNGEKDSFGSIMTERTLRNYVEDCNAGVVPFMLDHAGGVNKQIGRIVHADYNEAEKQVRATISMLRDTEKTPDALKIDEYIRRVERRFYNACSVGFRDAIELCNIGGCGKEIFDFSRPDPCEHVPKRFYNGEECTYDVDDAHLREVSLVSTPSNSGAKSLYDTREWVEDLRKVKDFGTDAGGSGDTDPKTLLERDGLKYRESLITKAVSEGIRAEDDFDEAKWKQRFDTMEADQIIDQTATWSKLGDARWGEGGRKTTDASGNGTGIEGGGGDLILPSYLFQY